MANLVTLYETSHWSLGDSPRKTRRIALYLDRDQAYADAKCPTRLYGLMGDFAVTEVPALEVDGEYWLLACAVPAAVTGSYECPR